MQISCVSKEKLLVAKGNPDIHQNLIVRVGGFSEYFCRLHPALQQMIIDRKIHN